MASSYVELDGGDGLGVAVMSSVCNGRAFAIVGLTITWLGLAVVATMIAGEWKHATSTLPALLNRSHLAACAPGGKRGA